MDFPMSGNFVDGVALLELELELLVAMVVFLPLACLASLFNVVVILLIRII